MEHFDRFDRNVIWTRFAMRFANIRNLYTEKRRREGKTCRVWIRVEFASMFVRAIEKFVEDAARWTTLENEAWGMDPRQRQRPPRLYSN